MNRREQKALERLDAQWEADDISAEQHQRESARIRAGTHTASKGLFDRVAAGEREAIIKLVVITFFVLVIIGLVGSGLELLAGGEYDD